MAHQPFYWLDSGVAFDFRLPKITLSELKRKKNGLLLFPKGFCLFDYSDDIIYGLTLEITKNKWIFVVFFKNVICVSLFLSMIGKCYTIYIVCEIHNTSLDTYYLCHEVFFFFWFIYRKSMVHVKKNPIGYTNLGNRQTWNRSMIQCNQTPSDGYHGNVSLFHEDFDGIMITKRVLRLEIYII